MCASGANQEPARAQAPHSTLARVHTCARGPEGCLGRHALQKSHYRGRGRRRAAAQGPYRASSCCRFRALRALMHCGRVATRRAGQVKATFAQGTLHGATARHTYANRSTCTHRPRVHARRVCCPSAGLDSRVANSRVLNRSAQAARYGTPRTQGGQLEQVRSDMLCLCCAPRCVCCEAPQLGLEPIRIWRRMQTVRARTRC